MEQNSPPKALGAFSPMGHVVISFPTAQDTDDAVKALADKGYRGEAVTRYSPEEMRAQVRTDLANASPIASLGQEVNLVRAHGELAEQGYSFLVVHAPKDEDAQQVADIARRFHAERAQKYGRFLIEELIEPEGADEQQTFESPARGLDAQTETGREQDRTPDPRR